MCVDGGEEAALLVLVAQKIGVHEDVFLQIDIGLGDNSVLGDPVPAGHEIDPFDASVRFENQRFSIWNLGWAEKLEEDHLRHPQSGTMWMTHFGSLWRAVGAAIVFMGSPANAQPAGFLLSGVPLVRQTYNACGPASVTEVLGYFGLSMRLQDVSRLTRPHERAYMTAEAIVGFAPQVGMEARLYSGGSLPTVRKSIQAGLPLIVLQDLVLAGGANIPHWRVVVGYDDAAQTVYLMDPYLGYVLMKQSDFLQAWVPHRGQFALLYPPSMRSTVLKTVG